MQWKLALVGALIVVGAIGAGIRHALQPPLALFIVPGATDIQVVERDGPPADHLPGARPALRLVCDGHADPGGPPLAGVVERGGWHQ